MRKAATVSKKSVSKLGLGVALFILGALLLSGRFTKKIEVVLSDSFASEPVSVNGFSQEKFPDNNLPKRVIIPGSTVDLEVKRAKVVNGYWEVFSDSAGWGEGSGLPGQIGNQVIFAHAREGLFLPLRSIKVGMDIYVLTDDSWYGYKVEQIKEVYPNEVEVIAPTEDETLTLYTCSGFRDSKRLIVVTKRVLH